MTVRELIELLSEQHPDDRVRVEAKSVGASGTWEHALCDALDVEKVAGNMTVVITGVRE